jgi:hypothetical protein
MAQFEKRKQLPEHQKYFLRGAHYLMGDWIIDIFTQHISKYLKIAEE